jgi:hypothetical protein
MRIKSITASATHHGDESRRQNGKDNFIAMQAVPDAGTWSLEEAEIAYYTLMARITTMSYGTMVIKGMLVDTEKAASMINAVSASFQKVITTKTEKITT